jgi:hypothetical protein
MGTSVSAPPDRILGNEFSGIADSSGEIFDKALDFSNDYFSNVLARYPELTAAERRGTAQQRKADTRQLESLGPRLFEAWRDVNPGLASSLDAVNAEVAKSRTPSPLLGRLNEMAMEGIDSTAGLGPTEIRRRLEQTALDDLDLGRSLSGDEERDVQQASRAAYQSRGIEQSNPALIGEVLARDKFGREREAMRRAYAGNVLGIAQREDESLANRRIALGNLGTQVEGLNDRGRDFALRAVGTNLAAQSPILGFFGRTSVAPGDVSSIMQGSSGLIQGFSPLLNYGSDLYNTNYNADASARIAEANNESALWRSVIEATGQAIGGAAAMCWVAREVLGEYEQMRIAGELTPKWIVFRDWLLKSAHPRMVKLYRRYGPAVARWLRRHPLVKQMIKPWFEEKVQRHSWALNREFSGLHA